MTKCPTCHHEQILGALFCSECGTQLVKFAGDPAEKTSENQETPFAASRHHGSNTTAGETDGSIYLQIETNGKILSLSGRDAYTLGRFHEGQSIVPDIDLNPFGGYEEGVSRLHASIHVESDKLKVTDLGSINGTSINGKKIPQLVPHLVANGDVLTLGKMKMRVIVR